MNLQVKNLDKVKIERQTRMLKSLGVKGLLVTNEQKATLSKLKNKHGVNVYRTPDSVMADQLKAWDVVTERFSNKDPFFKEVVESQKVYAKKVMAYLLLAAPDYRMAYNHHFGDPAKAI